MRKIKKVILLIVVFMIAVSIKSNTAFAEYVIQVVPGQTAWKEITVSDAYDECQKLNTNSSTLGTTSLKAHLTTNADWYAVGLLTYSAYGNKSSSNTTGNSTGIMNFGTTWTFTSSIMEGSSSNANIKSLYDNINIPYVEEVKNKTNSEQNSPGRGLLVKEYISTSSGPRYYNDGVTYPISVRSNLFGFGLGSVYNSSNYSSGSANASVTFRPVIWNK